MKLVLIWIVILIAIGIPVQAAPYIITGTEVNVRSEPSAESQIVATAKKGVSVEGVGVSGNWVRARFPNDDEGWIYRGILQPSSLSQAHASRIESVLSEEVLGKYWLLAIGVDDYEYWPRLNNAVGDAEKIVDIMIDKYGFSRDRVIELYNKKATEENIISVFIDLKNRLGANDSLLIYYAGHGVLDEFDVGSWVPVNASIGSITDYISTDRVNRMVAKLPARHVFLVADACYSGTLFTPRSKQIPMKINDRYFRENILRTSRQALSSGGIEVVQDGGGDGHSIFAYHFIRELELSNEPYISATWLSAKVAQMVARNADQEPRWNHLKNVGDENGEFFFIRDTEKMKMVYAKENTAEMSYEGEITIQTQPQAASVWIDGELMGETPLRLEGLTGKVIVRISKNGYKPIVEHVRTRFDRPQILSFLLEPHESVGKLYVDSYPSGAKWYLDGDYMGATPDQAVAIESGLHTIRIVGKGYEEWIETLYVSRGQEASLKLDLATGEKILIGIIASGSSPLSLNAHGKYDDQPLTLSSLEGDEKVTNPAYSDLERIESLLDEFVLAYNARDIKKIYEIAELSENRKKFLEQIFNTYPSINVRVIKHMISKNEASAIVQVDKLNLSNGDTVYPAKSWQQSQILIKKEQGRWGKIIW